MTRINEILSNLSEKALPKKDLVKLLTTLKVFTGDKPKSYLSTVTLDSVIKDIQLEIVGKPETNSEDLTKYLTSYLQKHTDTKIYLGQKQGDQFQAKIDGGYQLFFTNLSKKVNSIPLDEITKYTRVNSITSIAYGTDTIYFAINIEKKFIRVALYTNGKKKNLITFSIS